jgi:hypothetical protein
MNNRMDAYDLETSRRKQSTTVAAQDQEISKMYFKNKSLKEEIDSKCRLCKHHEETIYHTISGCPILAKNEYLIRHDRFGVHSHYSMGKALGIKTTDNLCTRARARTHTHPSQYVNMK